MNYTNKGWTVRGYFFYISTSAINQVKYQRTKLRKQHAKETLDELIEKCEKSKGEFLHSLQVSSEVRVVLTSKADEVKFCCNPDDFSVFGVDVTYDIGTFFVTLTTYKHLMLHDKQSGAHPNTPGPMMIHTDEGSAPFH